MPKILCFAGSTGSKSVNKRLAQVATKMAKAAGAEITYIELNEYPMPLYDSDLEAKSGLPENAKALKALFIKHDAFLISSPEYNSSVTGVLKNAIDWVSRAEQGEKGLVAFAGKTAGLISASPGALGGLRGLVHLRAILGNIGVLVISEQAAVSAASEAFDSDGNLKDEGTRKRVENVVKRLIEVTTKLYG